MGRGDRRQLVKVRFELDPHSLHGHASETLWAEHVSDGRYRLRNSPFYAYGVSAEDVVIARTRDASAQLFEEVSERGGHSTYRLVLQRGLDDPIFQKAWEPLEKLACTFEGADGSLLAVDVPPPADIHAVYAFLERGESEGAWTFEEGHCGHPL